MFEDFTDSELLELCELAPRSQKVRDAINQAEDEGIGIDRDEVYAEYWHRNLASADRLDERAVATLLNLPDYASARSTLGDAARVNKLSMESIDEILAKASDKEWFYRQVLARKLLNGFSRMRLGLRIVGFHTVDEMMNSLIALKTAWAILETVPFLTDTTLMELSARMQETDVLNRHDRHRVREAIRRQLRS